MEGRCRLFTKTEMPSPKNDAISKRVCEIEAVVNKNHARSDPQARIGGEGSDGIGNLLKRRGKERERQPEVKATESPSCASNDSPESAREEDHRKIRKIGGMDGNLAKVMSLSFATSCKCIGPPP
jgi:hypothetical protein